MARLILTAQLWSKRQAILLEDSVYNKLEYKQAMEEALYHAIYRHLLINVFVKHQHYRVR
ncbi:hypothetical protein [Colwellia ponticola]|uniref:Uncharacterized protein n=1 Tax=Colwellia ponticola TaxID=2304625 RepID=A0A8H2JQ74_9GAMM|nr:hypothetical protein [Colwellia ponticola]TMM47905.1 hypothetical protein FCS21_02790 [Colwellia ponticola]